MLVQNSRANLPALPLTTSVILGVLLNLSGYQLAQITDSNNNTYPHKIAKRFSGRTSTKHLEWCLTGGQGPVNIRSY